MINIIVLAITAACVLFGFILGIIRGFSRSLLRFLLIAVCAAGAWFLRGLLTDIVMGININGQKRQCFAVFQPKTNSIS